jgi:hypothetical protein
MFFILPPKRAEEAELEPASELFAWSTGRAHGASSTVSLLAAVPKFPAGSEFHRFWARRRANVSKKGRQTRALRANSLRI